MKQKIFVILFTCMVAGLVVFNITAHGDVSDSIDQEESRINEKEERLNEIQRLLNELNDSKGDLDIYLANLNDSYRAISAYIEELESDRSEKQSQIDEINEELIRAGEEQSEQYEAMKVRIQYMYENSENSYIMAMFSDEPLSDILNRLEYTAELLEYDRTKLREYQQLLIYIEASKMQLEEELNELDKLALEQKEKQSEMSVMISDAANNISSKEAQIDEAEARAEQLAREIQAGKDTIEELKAEESRRIEESIRQSREQASREAAGIYEEQTTVGAYQATDRELMMLAAILYCEARGEPYEGILAVGSVVMNRVEDPRFPNTIEEVIVSPGQFSPVASGLYAIALAKGSNETCIQAAKEILYGGVRVGPWLYFRTVNGIIQGTVIGNHVFYSR